MKTFISIFAVTLAFAFTVPAFAGDTAAKKAEEQCQKDNGNWDAKKQDVLRKILKSISLSPQWRLRLSGTPTANSRASDLRMALPFGEELKGLTRN